MATRYPLIVDTTDDNKIKELPTGDNLNLSGNNIVNAINITATGVLSANSLVLDTTSATFGGQTLNTVAFTGQYNDLSGAPTPFSGSYNDLSDRPVLVTSIEELTNVDDAVPNDNDVLKYSTSLGRYVPQAASAISVASANIQELNNVTVDVGLAVNQVLKWNGSNWANSNVAFSEITGKPTTLASYGITDALKIGDDYTGSVFADDSTLLVDGVSGTIPATNLSGALPALDGSLLTGVLHNIVEDTTPVLGGDLVIGTNKLKYTASGDGGSQLVLAKTMYSVPNTTVFSSVGSIDLFIDSLSSDTAQTAFRIFNNTDPDGTVTETNNIFKVDGNTGNVSITGKLLLPDGSASANYAGFGADDDLKIFHNGNHSIIRETGTGDLYLQSDNNVILGSDSDTETYVKGIYNGAVELYHDNVKKLETTANGIEVEGSVTSNFIGSVFADDSSQMLDAETQTLYGTIVATAGTAPTVSGQPGAVGEIRFDDNYIYVKTSGAGWKRAALSGLV